MPRQWSSTKAHPYQTQGNNKWQSATVNQLKLSKRAKVNFASLAAISKADEIRKDDKEADSKLSKMSSAISSNENEKAVELASDSQPEPQ